MVDKQDADKLGVGNFVTTEPLGGTLIGETTVKAAGEPATVSLGSPIRKTPDDVYKDLQHALSEAGGSNAQALQEAGKVLSYAALMSTEDRWDFRQRLRQALTAPHRLDEIKRHANKIDAEKAELERKLLAYTERFGYLPDAADQAGYVHLSTEPIGGSTVRLDLVGKTDHLEAIIKTLRDASMTFVRNRASEFVENHCRAQQALIGGRSFQNDVSELERATALYTAINDFQAARRGSSDDVPF